MLGIFKCYAPGRNQDLPPLISIQIAAEEECGEGIKISQHEWAQTLMKARVREKAIRLARIDLTCTH
jgi:hypothetical protein